MSFDQESLIRSISVAGLKKYMLFCGAGTSASSGIPTAEQCIWRWKQEIYLSKHPQLKPSLLLDATLPNVQHRIQRWLDQQGSFPPNGTPDEYSHYIEYAYPRHEDRQRFFTQLFNGAVPQLGYRLLALLHNAQIFQWVWTTNFDGLVRQARTPKQTIPLKEAGLDTSLRVEGFDDTDDAAYLVHLHGDYRHDKLSNTNEEIAKLDEILRKKLIERLRKRPMIIIGYGGWDESILSAMEEAVSTQAEGGGVYWCVSAGKKPNQRVERLLEQGRNQKFDSQLIEIEHFDDFMMRIARFVLRNRPEIAVVEELLAVEPPTRAPLRLPDNEPQQNWLKSNGFPCTLPTSLYQCDVTGINSWSDLREQIGDRRLCAGLLRRKVLSLGAIEEIRAAFGKGITSEILSVPLGEDDYRVDGVVIGILHHALVITLSEHCNVDSIGKHRLVEKEREGVEKVEGAFYNVHRAAIIELSHIGSQTYFHIIPDVVARATDGRDIADSVRKEIKRRRLSRQWNKAYYDEVERWKQRIFGNENQVTLRFPSAGTHDFRFSLRAPARYAELLLPNKPRGGTSKVFPNVEFRALLINEPQLRFCEIQTPTALDAHPMRGLVKFGPYDAELAREQRCSELNVGVVAPQGFESRLIPYLRQLTNPHTAIETKAEYLVSYPGFQQAYRLPLILPTNDSSTWRNLPALNLDIARPLETQRQIIGAIEREIEALRATAQTDVIVIFVPKAWQAFERLELEGVRHDLHDYVKAFSVQRGVSTQFLREETFAKAHQCEVLWWLAQSLYVKSMRTPYILGTQDTESVFVGIGYGVTMHRSMGGVVLGCSHLYDAAGHGLRYVVSRINQPVWRNRNPYLTRDDAMRVGLQARQLFWDTYFRLPERVVLHKKTPFLDSEIEGFSHALKGVSQLDMLTFEYENAWRFLAYNPSKREADGFPVRRGTVMPMNDNQCLLWVHGGTAEVNPQSRIYFQGKSRIPVPVRITRFMGHTPLVQLASEVLGLSKMDWNSFDLYSQMPATLESSGAIAHIGQLLSRFGTEMYDYRLFM